MKRKILSAILYFMFSVCSFAQTSRASLYISKSMMCEDINFIGLSTIAFSGEEIVVSILEFPLYNEQTKEFERELFLQYLRIIEKVIADDGSILYSCINSSGKHCFVSHIKKNLGHDEFCYCVPGKDGVNSYVWLRNVKKVDDKL